jgi:hypothetical protein
MKLLLTLLSMATLAAAGTITGKDYTDASCTTAATECGVDDADLDGNGDCPVGKTTEKPTLTMAFTAGTCVAVAGSSAAATELFSGWASQAPAASWKIVCSGGKGVVKLFTDSACATAIASATVLDTKMNTAMNGVTAGSARRRSHSCAPLPQRFYL